MDGPISILLIESQATHAHTINAMLGEYESLFSQIWVMTLEEALDLLSATRFDVILTNVVLGDAGGPDIVHKLLMHHNAGPIIVIVNAEQSDIARDVLSFGAQDYVGRDTMSPALLKKCILFAIERERLRNQIRSLTLRDDLTQLYNRRGFSSFANQQLRIVKRTHRPASLIYIDMDNLKAINDNLGHQSGDFAIAEIADILRQVLRNTDIIGRVGGDEFIVLAPDTDSLGVLELISRIAQATKERNIPGVAYELHASLGTITYDGENDYDLEQMTTEAEMLMYEHKRSKRNG